jgi:hypothetical protein
MADTSTIKYKIVQLDKTIGRILVNYYTNISPSGVTIYIDLALDSNGNVISGDELTALIISNSPISQLNVKEAADTIVANRKQIFENKDFSHIEPLVSPIFIPPSN